MAKALKIVGTIVAVVAIAASAVATFGASLGIGTTILGVSASTIGTYASLAALGVGLAAAAFAPKPSFSNQGNPLDFQTNPQSGLPYAIGRTRMSGLRIHADTYDSPAFKSEGKDDVLAFGVLLSAGGPIDGIERFTADKEEISFDPSSGNATGGFANWMAQKVSLGAVGASALALTFGGVPFPGWTADHKLSGHAHALWDLRYDDKGEHYGAGVPEPAWVLRGVKTYDPRKDSTYPGGSGPHRALDESTYEWSRNPALHALTWALGRWQNDKKVLGIGAPIENIRVADFVEAANVADANDWTCGGVEWSTDSKWSILKKMLQAGGAEPTMTGAMIGCRVNTPRVSIATVTRDDLLDSASFPTTRSRRDRFNTVIPRYRSEDHDWEVVSGSPITVPLYVTEDGGRRTKEIDFPLVQNETPDGGLGNIQAGQLAAYEIVNSREAGPWRFTVGPKFIGIKTGDVITLDLPDESIDERPVLVRSRSIDPATFKITFEVETENTAKHDFALGKTTTPPPSYTPTPPDLTPPQPNPALWSLTEGATADGVPALIVEGVCEFPGADSVLIDYHKVGETAWISQGKFDSSAPVKHVISPVDGAVDYSARVAYQSGNRIGPWLLLGEVETPGFTVGGTDIDLIIDAVEDFNLDNNGNGTTPPGVTGIALEGVNYNDSTGQTFATWSYTVDTDPGAASNIDGFKCGAMIRSSSASYTYGGPSDDNLLQQWQEVSADHRRVSFDCPVDQYITVVIIPFRKVRTTVDADGVIKGPPAQSITPFRQASAPDFNGTIDGDTAENVRIGAARARVAIKNDSTIADGKVLTGSIAEDALNQSDWVPQGATLSINTSEVFNNTYVGVTSTGDRLVVRAIIDYQIRVVDPNEGDEVYFNFNLVAKRVSTGTEYLSDTVTLSEVWSNPSASGMKYFSRKTVMIEAVFDALPGGAFDAGYKFTTNAGCGVLARGYRFLWVEDRRALG